MPEFIHLRCFPSGATRSRVAANNAIGLLASGLFLAVLLLPVKANDPADEREVRALAEQYFGAYARKDLEGFMALWSEKSPDFATRKQTMQRIFAQTGDIQLKELTIVRSELAGESARLRVQVELIGNDRQSGKLHPDLGKLNRVLQLVREKSVWKVWRYGPADQDLLDRLLAADGKAERERLLKQDRDLVTPQVVSLVNDNCLQLLYQGQRAQAQRRNDLAFEVAAGLSDPRTQAWCHFCRGALCRAGSQPREALAAFERALALFREVKDRRGEADTLHDIGSVYQSTGPYAEALRYYQDCLKLFREMGNRRGEANALGNLGNVCRSLGRYAEALRHYQDCLKIKRERGDRREEAITLGNLGNVYQSMGDYAEALRFHQDSLKIDREFGDRAGVAGSLGNIGLVYESTGRYDEALRSHQDSLKIMRELGDWNGEARTLNNIGLVHHATGQYAEALRSHQDSLKIVRQRGDRPGEADSLGNIGIVYCSTGRYAEALRCQQDNLKIVRELGDRKKEANTLNNIGLVLQATGRYDEALRYHRDSLKIFREIGARGGEAATLDNIGLVYESTGRIAESLRYHQDSLKIQRELGDRQGEAIALRNLGNVYQSTSQYAEALRHQEDSLKIFREIGARAREAATLGNIGRVHSSKGQYAKVQRSHQDSLNHYAEALRYFQDSLKIMHELGDRKGEANALNNIGNVNVSLGHYAEALRSHQDSLRIHRELGDREGEASSLNNIGFVYYSRDQFVQALESYQAGLQLAESIGHNRTVYSCWWGMGNVHEKQKQWSEAAAVYRQVIDRIELVRAATREHAMQITFLRHHIKPYNGLVHCLLQLGRPAEAFAAAEHASARTLVDILQSGKADVRKGLSEEQRRQEQQLQDRLTALSVELESLNSRKVDRSRQEELARQLERARQDYDAFRRDLFLRLPELQVRRAAFQSASLTDLNRALFAEHPRLVVLSYMIHDRQTLLFVLTPGQRPDDPANLTVHTIEVEAKELADAVEQFRSGCQNPGAGTPDGADLDRWLLAPAAAELAGASQVVIVPSEVLHTLPFHALRGEDGKYLVERCAVSYAPSVTAVLKMAELGRQRRGQQGTGAAEDGLLAVGITDFGRREPRLPAAEGEARSVAGLFGGASRLLLGQEATRAKLMASWSGARELHLATHGRLNENVPLYSAVVLSRGDNDEGLLFGRDLLDADLSAELVVLSSCETGLGQQMAGEGLLGLSWAWFVAGVPSLVVSQWQVSDEATAALMTAFWTEVRQGTPKAEALRRAQLKLLQDRKTRHPFSWAPFVLLGDFASVGR